MMSAVTFAVTAFCLMSTIGVSARTNSSTASPAIDRTNGTRSNWPTLRSILSIVSGLKPDSVAVTE